nr:hypothetical protein GCM10020063_014510 [Dactylosporangium thailandense]
MLAAGGAVALAPAATGPSPDAKSTVSPRVLTSARYSAFPADPSFPVRTNTLVATGLAFGDHEELVLWYDDPVNGVRGGLYDERTARLRTLAWAGIRGEGFGIIGELDDRNGGILDYGVVGGDDARVTVKAGGRTAEATTAPVPGVPGHTMFWVRRGGVLAGTTAEPNPATPDAVFTAYSSGGTKLAESTSSGIQRADTIVNRDDVSRRIGDPIDTGVMMADGSQLQLWFDGDDHTALLRASTAPDRILMTLSRPPSDPGGFYHAVFTVDGAAGGRKVKLCIYVGDGVRVQMGGAGVEQSGSRAWSAYPRLKVAWAKTTDAAVSAVAFDAAGTMVAATDFR